MKARIVTLEDLKRFLQEYFRGRAVEIYLFGSRAREEAREGSDVDLAFLSEEPLSKDLALIREILEESLLPYKVDLVEIRQAPYLKEIVKKEGIKWI